MAFVAPTFAITGSTAVANQASSVVVTITANASDDVGFKVKKVRINAGDFPCNIGKSTLLTQGGAPGGGTGGPGVGTAPTDYVANAGSEAVTVIKVPIVYLKAGTATVTASIEVWNDNTDEKSWIAADADLTVTVS